MEIIRITDIHDERLQMYTGFNEVQLKRYYEPHGGVFVAETALVISRALEAGCRPISFLIEEKCYEAGILDEITNESIPCPVYIAPLDVINQLIGYNLTRGVLCAMMRPELSTPAELLQNSRKVCILEDVMNPTNVGAIFRSAAALGIDAVILTEGSSDPLYRRAARVSMGTVFSLPFTFFEKDSDYMDILKKEGYTTVSMALKDNAVPVSSPLLKGHEKLAVIFGTESTGIKEKTLATSDYIAIIPMQRSVDSLNVAAASAVAFWELCDIF